MPERPARSRSFGPTVLVGLLGAPAAAVAGAKDWAHVDGSAAGIRVSAVAKGSESAPLATALGLGALAAWGVVLVTRGRVRRAVSVLGALASAGVLLATVLAFGSTRDDALAQLAGKGTTSGAGHASLTGWYYATAVGALLSLAAFAVATVRSPGWPAMGTKYDAPGARAEQPQSEQDMWRALDEGHDPTS
ncbi:MAG: Trp biosynthesis-associated membrane protein [Nocardioidaceae bacterium]